MFNNLKRWWNGERSLDAKPDEEAIASDWEFVGNTLRDVFDKVREEIREEERESFKSSILPPQADEPILFIWDNHATIRVSWKNNEVNPFFTKLISEWLDDLTQTMDNNGFVDFDVAVEINAPHDRRMIDYKQLHPEFLGNL